MAIFIIIIASIYGVYWKWVNMLDDKIFQRAFWNKKWKHLDVRLPTQNT
jgi:hypothetical protein